MQANDKKAEGLNAWLETGLLREIIAEKKYTIYCMAEMFYIIFPHKQYKIDPNGNKYCIMIGPQELKDIASYGLSTVDFNLRKLKILNRMDLLLLLSDYNLQEILKAKMRMNEQGIQFLPENIDYELEQNIQKRRVNFK